MLEKVGIDECEIQPIFFQEIDIFMPGYEVSILFVRKSNSDVVSCFHVS